MQEEQLNLFSVEQLFVPIEDRIQRALETVLELFQKNVPIVIGYSGGKDSSVVTALVLHAAVAHKSTGGSPLVIVTSSDTLVESPEVSRHIRQELAKMKDFARRHDIRLITKIVQPNLSSSWQIKVLSGRGIPSFPGTDTDCSVDLKITPQNAYRRKLFRTLNKQGLPHPVTCLGTRFEESDRRAMLMKQRGERADQPVKNKLGEMVLSLVAHWSTEDIWEAIALYGSSSQEYPSFSNYAEVKRIYAHAAGTSCAVVADAIYEGVGRKKGGCGARHGCHVCQQSVDKSLENMIEFDSRYEYARGLNRLNKFIRATRYDWNRRHWVGRTINGGYVKVEPDTYHPSMLRELTRYMLQLDHDERERTGGAPMFQLLPLEMMIAVDALQSLNGIARPFQIWADYDEIVNQGVRYDIPEIDISPSKPMPETRFLYVGDDWHKSCWAGLRDPLIESVQEGAGCGHEIVTLENGHEVWKLTTDDVFDVDPEAAALLFEFEYERLLEMHRAGFVAGGITAGYKWYLQYGVIKVQHSHQKKHDEICRRTSFKDQLGLTLEYDLKHLLAQTVRFADLPHHAAREWAKKATTDSAQMELLPLAA